MSAPRSAAAQAPPDDLEIDLVAQAVADAPEDDRDVTNEELAALREARADSRPFVPHSEIAAWIAERARVARDEP